MKTTEKKLLDLYFANLELIEDTPAVLNRQRSDAIEAFNLMGLPDRKNEKYKYSRIEPLYARAYEYFFTPSGEGCQEDRSLCDDCYELRLLNGFAEGLRTLDNGIIFGSLRAASEEYPELVGDYCNRLAAEDMNTDGTVALNTAFTQDGAFVYVPKGVRAEKPFAVVNCFDTVENTAIFVRTLFVCGENASARFIFESHTAKQSDLLINSVSEIFTERNGQAEMIFLQRENDSTDHISNAFISQAGYSNVRSAIICMDGRFIRNNTNVYLNEGGAENHTYGLFIADNGQHIDNFTNIEHRVADCTSFENFKGVASGRGSGAFNGRILVKTDAQRTQAFQENHNLLLSDTAVVNTKPQLEIYADDVKCSHGATVGQLDEAALFYMRQRGIGEKSARQLQIYGFVNEIVDKITIGMLAENVAKIVSDKIEQM